MHTHSGQASYSVTHSADHDAPGEQVWATVVTADAVKVTDKTSKNQQDQGEIAARLAAKAAKQQRAAVAEPVVAPADTAKETK